MPFTCSEFPGQSFNSLEELKALRASRRAVLEKMYSPIVVQVKKEELHSE